MQIAIVAYPDFTALDLIGPYRGAHALRRDPAPDIVLVPGGPGTSAAARDPEPVSRSRG
ncbi:hypothetical protein [Tsukamurella sp. PLM1]|uniref:hypothetical protein n=1 Tax=Tsukamurella sp. PLM1 TaxID=2929795 RepID=UPI00206A395B|nr:hypothetical protein [Tsukamurella sp. PLM1]BDH57875.1 hypothetical protein MTP03_28140 [Tsukamurella sp. PLM1]